MDSFLNLSIINFLIHPPHKCSITTAILCSTSAASEFVNRIFVVLFSTVLNFSPEACNFFLGKGESEVAQSYLTLVTPYAPPSMGFSRQEYWSGLKYTLKIVTRMYI